MGKIILEEYLEKIPEQHRHRISLLEEFKGNRTNISYIFECGHSITQLLKSFFSRGEFNLCVECKLLNNEKNKIIYTCKYCSSTYTKINNYNKCLLNCKLKYDQFILFEDYIICAICEFHGKSLGLHIYSAHNISSEEYQEKYGPVICSKSSETYSKANEISGNWINRAKQEGKDLTEYKQKMGSAVRDAILNDPNERKRRAELMTKVNQSDIMREKSSETAKRTSARPEIQAQRAEKLKIWRDENPDEFHEKCVSKMITTFQSKPEKILFNFIVNLVGFNFEKNQFIKGNNFLSKSKRKQIDMADKIKRIYIEFDGAIHFKPFRGQELLEKIKNSDKATQEHISNHNWTLIRVSHDQFIYKTKMINKIKQDASYFKQECLDKIVEILNSNQPGIYKIGEAYGKH